jgi:putative redox protein
VADDAIRSIEVQRVGKHHYTATNVRGGTLDFGSGDDAGFTPIEMLLAAIGGCTALDVEHITEKRAEPLALTFTTSAEKVRDDDGNHLTGIEIVIRAEFPASEAGDAAREILPDALRRSHDRLCTVSRTIELGATVTARLDS